MHISIQTHSHISQGPLKLITSITTRENSQYRESNNGLVFRIKITICRKTVFTLKQDQQYSDAIISQSNITWYCTQQMRQNINSITSSSNSQNHPIPRPHGLAMEYLLWISFEKTVIKVQYYVWQSSKMTEAVNEQLMAVLFLTDGQEFRK